MEERANTFEYILSNRRKIDKIDLENALNSPKKNFTATNE